MVLTDVICIRLSLAGDTLILSEVYVCRILCPILLQRGCMIVPTIQTLGIHFCEPLYMYEYTFQQAGAKKLAEICEQLPLGHVVLPVFYFFPALAVLVFASPMSI